MNSSELLNNTSDLQNSLSNGVVASIFTFGVTAINNLLMLAIIHYERFGGDPQKRGLGNRIISAMLWSTLFSSDAHFLTLFSQDQRIVLAVMRGLKISAITFMNLHAMVIYLQVVVFKQVKEIDDELVAACLQRAVYMGSMFFSFIFPIDPAIMSRIHNTQAMNGTEPRNENYWNCLLEPLRPW